MGSILTIAGYRAWRHYDSDPVAGACTILLEVSMSTFTSFSTVRPYKIWAGAVARAVHGERVTMALIDLDPNLDIPEHHHVNEQLGFVVLGKVTMVIGGEEKELAAGDAYSIKSDVPHSARTGQEGATVIDVFAPVRSDWEKAERLEPSRGHWPR
jgi:quercetin dioxygenase-like cupin family protein